MWTIASSLHRELSLDWRLDRQLFPLQAEIKKLQELLSSSEQQLEAECQKSIGLNQQLAQLTEIKELLQLQLDAGGSTGTAAEKLVRIWHVVSSFIFEL